MLTEIQTSYLVTIPQNLINAGIDISTRRRSLDGSLVVIDFVIFTTEQMNTCFTEENQIENFNNVKNKTVVEVNAMMKEGYTLYTADDAYALMQTPAWYQGEY